MAMLVSACKPEGYINTVKYNGEKHINTCETFTADINKLVSYNNDPSVLQVAKYDNSDFDYYYLEPGQFEIKNDTLNFRLAQDLKYEQYLDKGVAVLVSASYRAVDNLGTLETNRSGDIGTLKVDRTYWIENRRPLFLYKIPMNGAELAGKQLMLSFAVAKYDKQGNLKNFFCQTDAQPLGPATPSCCTSGPWANTRLQSIVDFPDISANEAGFKYKGFTGTIDVMFQENSFDLGDDSTFNTLLIQAFINKYKNLGYKITRIDLSGWASPGGKESLNMKLSQARAEALIEGLKSLNGTLEGLEISGKGMGEDWERVKFKTRTSTLTADEKDQVLAIANDPALTNDQKEAKLRKVSFWEQLVEEVLIKARHTFCVMDFEYAGTGETLERFTERLPVASRELEDVANEVITVSPFKEGMNMDEAMASLNDILTKKASPNLYAIRATYHLAQDNISDAIADLERASSFRDAKSVEYANAVQGYKVLFADNYAFDQQLQMYKDFTELTQKNPGDRKLFFNRAILMDKIGFLSGALAEYDALLDGQTPTDANMVNRGVAKLKSNMFSEAEVDFKDAVRLNNQIAEAYFNLAAISAYRGLTRKTMEYLDQAIALKPSFKEFIFNNPVFSAISEGPEFDKYRQ